MPWSVSSWMSCCVTSVGDMIWILMMVFDYTGRSMNRTTEADMRDSDKDRWKGVASAGLFMAVAILILIIILFLCAMFGRF